MWDYVESLINSRDRHIIRSYYAYTRFALTNPAKPSFFKSVVVRFDDPQGLNFMGASYGPQVVVQEFRTPEHSKKKFKGARSYLGGYKTNTTNTFHECAKLVSLQISEEEDRWLGPLAKPRRDMGGPHLESLF